PPRGQLQVRGGHRLAAGDPVRADAQGHAGVLAITMIRTSHTSASPQTPAADALPNGNGRVHPQPFLTALPARNGALRVAAKNVLSVDLEDWYQGLEIDMSKWDAFPSRIDSGLETLLDLLDTAEVKATFFVLGWQAERTPHIVPRLAARGHEIAS